MKRAKLTNRELDSLGREMVKAGAVNEAKIDKIVSDTSLYTSVLSRIAVEPETQSERIGWPSKLRLVSAAVIVMMLVSLIGYFRVGNSESVSVNPQVPRKVYTVNEAKKLFEPVAQPTDQPEEDEIKPVRAVITRAAEKTAGPKAAPQRTKPVQAREADFHAFGHSENAEDAVLDGRVVRVEMPRAALFALGVDLPLENGTKAVKADLLVGSDGVPKGIRLVE